jgi:hypothetical protein
MPRETAAQKLAQQEADLTAATAGHPEGDRKPPVIAPYTLFGYVTAILDSSYGSDGAGVWLPLGEVEAPTYQHAMELAKDKLRNKILAAATEGASTPSALKVTVAAIASRNWNQGTALIELRPVTTWEK